MTPMNILNITAKSAPIPTIAAIIIYFVYPHLIESNPSETVLILISVLTFLFLLALLAYGAYKKENQSFSTSMSDNSIIDAKVEEGDIFIGAKGGVNSKDEILNNNKIEAVTSKTGDVFIGTKK